MEFEVAPGPLRERGRVRAAIVAACAVGIIAVAVVTAEAPAPAPSAPVEAAASAVPSSAPTGRPTGSADRVAAGSRGARPPMREPDALTCHDLDPFACGEVARASSTVLPAGDRLVAAISVWGSLLCNDAGDCPSSRLQGNRPLGSSIVWLVSGAQAWINVVEAAPAVANASAAPSPSPRPAQTVAWIIRWDP